MNQRRINTKSRVRMIERDCVFVLAKDDKDVKSEV
jgi:hypothetical protein